MTWGGIFQLKTFSEKQLFVPSVMYLLNKFYFSPYLEFPVSSDSDAFCTNSTGEVCTNK